MKKGNKRVFFIVLFAIIINALILTSGVFSAASACSYYASPTGSGNGLSQSSPFKIKSFWSVAKPGDILCLLDGTYTGSSNMINPPDGFGGTQNNPIVVKAINDGEVILDGQGSRTAIRFWDNHWITVEGVDAHSSHTTQGQAVVWISGQSSHIIIKRVCAWDAGITNNSSVYQVTNTSLPILFEDVCGFGTGRKIFQFSFAGNNVTLRRAWGRWEANTSGGPIQVSSLGYNSYNNTIESSIFTWDSTGTDTKRYGLFLTGGAKKVTDKCTNLSFYGNIGYIRATDTVESWIAGLYSFNSHDCVTWKDNVMYIEPGSHTNLKPVEFSSLSAEFGGPSVGNHNASNITVIGDGRAPNYASDWNISKMVDVDTVALAPNIFNGAGSNGARVCKRYVNGVLTNDPLWPWPMNQRIIDALTKAGKPPVDLTATMESIFGPIPPECRRSTIVSEPSSNPLPPGPTDLRLQ